MEVQRVHPQFITIPLNLPEFQVVKIIHNDSRKAIMVHLKVHPDYIIRCPFCGFADKLTCHGEKDKRRRVRDLDALEFRVFLWVPVIRRFCNCCESTFTVQFTSIDEKQKTTN
jgi:transposase